MSRTTWLVTGALLANMLVSAQTRVPKSRAPVKPRVVSGRVFLITKGGDIKPARLAKVLLLSLEGEKSLGMFWYTDNLRRLREVTEEELDPPRRYWTDAALCRRELATYTKSAGDSALGQGE